MKTTLSNIVAIYRKELQGYFASPLAYIVAAVFWLLSGFFFVALLLGPEGILQRAALQDLQTQQLGIPAPPVDIPYEFLRLFLGIMGSLILFLLPLLSMGLYAEERKRGTLELLATSPITNWSVAVGKLLGVVTFFITMVMPLLLYEAIALSASSPSFPATLPLLGHLGLILLAAAVLSLGMFLSSLTESTIVAAILTFGVILFLLVIDLVGKSIGGPVGEVINYLSLQRHYNNFVQGVFDPGSFTLLLSYILLGLFLTAQSIDALRFQRS